MKHAKPLPRIDINALDTRVGLALFNEIMQKWGVKRREALVLLGDIAPSTYSEWKKQKSPKLPHDTIVRISYIIGIVKGLRIIFGNTLRADQWVQKPNQKLQGKSALDVMLQGEIVDLAFIRSLIDTARGQ